MTVTSSAPTDGSANGAFDVIVVGGGLVGGPVALALALRGWHVALVERQVGPAVPADPLDQRCTALSAGSVAWLQSQGLWSALDTDAAPIRRVHVSHRGRFGSVRMDAGEQGLDALGHVIENRRFLQALAPCFEARGVHRCLGDAVASVQPSDSDVRVELQSGAALSGRLLIATDGVSSTIREALGIAMTHVDYDQQAILGTLRLNRAHEDTAYERFTDTGPLALLPRPDRCMSFVECIDVSDADRLQSLSDTEYRSHLQERFGHRLGRFQAVGPRTVVPLVRMEAQAQTGHRTVLLGNAVRLLHPVAGQGYNLALRDAAALVRVLDEARGSGVDGAVVAHVPDPGSDALLEAFSASRRPDQKRVVALTDLLARGFRGHNAPVAHLRALALMGIDTIGPLRRGFTRRSTGLPG